MGESVRLLDDVRVASLEVNIVRGLVRVQRVLRLADKRAVVLFGRIGDDQLAVAVGLVELLVAWIVVDKLVVLGPCDLRLGFATDSALQMQLVQR